MRNPAGGYRIRENSARKLAERGRHNGRSGAGICQDDEGTRLLRNSVHPTLANAEESGKMNMKRRHPFGQLEIIGDIYESNFSVKIGSDTAKV